MTEKFYRIPNEDESQFSGNQVPAELNPQQLTWPLDWNTQQVLRRWLTAALEGVEFGETTPAFSSSKGLQAVVYDFGNSLGTGDGKFYMHIDSRLDGFSLVDVHAEVITAGTTGTTDIQIANVTQGVDMLSTKLTLDSGETGSDTAATPAVINTSNDLVTENDVLRIDIDAISTTAPKGLIVTLGFA